jgi:hypothetical protein
LVAPETLVCLTSAPARRLFAVGSGRKGNIVKRDFALLFLIGLLTGCETFKPSPVTTHYDEFTGQRTDLLSDNMLETENPREVIWLNASRVFNKGGKSIYYLEASYMAKTETGWLDIGPGQSLTIMADNEKIKFISASGSLNRRKKLERNAFVQETAIYEATRDQLQKIGAAKQVKVELKGNNGLVERQFAPANFERFRAFVARYAI